MKIRQIIFCGLCLLSFCAESTQKAIQLTLPPSSTPTRTEAPPISLSFDSNDTRKKRCAFYENLETEDPDLLRTYESEMAYFCDPEDQ
jgi:hypothetical protein